MTGVPSCPLKELKKTVTFLAVEISFFVVRIFKIKFDAKYEFVVRKFACLHKKCMSVAVFGHLWRSVHDTGML